MSYILEALKKADAERERERDAVPGLHSRHGHSLPHENDEAHEGADTSPAKRTLWLVGGIVGGVAVAGVLFGWLGRPGHDAPPTGEATPPSAFAHDPVIARAPSPVAPPVVTPAPAPAPVAAPAVIAAPSPTVTAHAPPAAAMPSAPPTPASPDPLRVDPSLREAAPKIVPLQALPEHIRRELPQLSVGGAMHSDVASSRMLVLNGGVYREGEQPAPGVVLEEIRLKSAVLRYKGHRYSISY